MTTERTDADLIRAIRNGETGLCDTLITRHFSNVYVLAIARLRDHDAAEDLAQEVFLRACLHLDELAKPERFGGWVATVARRLASTWVRDGQRRSRLLPRVSIDETALGVPDSRSEGAREAMMRTEEHEALRAALDRLPDDQREAVLLHFGEGLTQREIAGLLGVHASTVNRLLTRALESLRGILEPVLRDVTRELRPRRLAAHRATLAAGAALSLPAAARAELTHSSGIGVLGLAIGGTATGSAALKVLAAAVLALAITGGIRLAGWRADARRPESLPSAANVSAPSSPGSAPHRSVDSLPIQSVAPVPDAEPTSIASPDSAASATGETLLLRVTGHVRDRAGQPIGGAVVTLRPTAPIEAVPFAAGTTDMSGAYEIVNPHLTAPPPDRPYDEFLRNRAVAEAPGHARIARYTAMAQSADDSRVSELDEDGFHAETLDFTLPAAESIAGTVLWEDGEPVPRALVVATSMRDINHAETMMSDFTFAFAEADEQGRFELTQLAPGDVRIAAAPPGQPVIPAGDATVGNRDLTVRLSRQTCTVSGTIAYVFSRTPVPRMPVRILSRPLALYPPDLWRATTDGSGRFRFEGLPPAHLWIEPEADRYLGGLEVTLTPAAASQEIEILLPERHRVAGIAREMATGEPIPDLGLRVYENGEPIEVRTDAEGHFDFGELTIGITQSNVYHRGAEYEILQLVELTEPGHLFRGSSSGWAPARSPEELEQLELMIESARCLRVRTFTPQGRPAAGVALQAVPPGGTGRGARRIGTSDGFGVLEATLPFSLNRFFLSGRSDEWPLFLSSEMTSADTEATVCAVEATTLRVRVADAAGNPVPDAPIGTVYQDPATRQPLSDTIVWLPNCPRTNAQGIATLDNLPRVPIEIGILPPVAVQDQYTSTGAMTSRLSVDLNAPNASREVTIVLDQSTVRGIVIAMPTRTPVAGARVAWVMDNGAAAISGTNGRFTLEGTALQSHAGLQATAPGYAPSSAARLPQSDVTFELWPEIVVRGRVTGPDGRAASHVPLFLFRPSADTRAAWAMPVREFPSDAWTDADGAFTYRPRGFHFPHDVNDGPVFMVAADGNGRIAIRDSALDLTQPQDVDLGDMALAPGCSLRGRILDVSGNPVGGAQIYWEGDRARLWPMPVAGIAWTCVAVEDGTYRLGPLPPGHWRLPIDAPGFEPQMFEVDLTAGETERDFRLSGERRLIDVTLRILDENGEPVAGAEANAQAAALAGQPVSFDSRRTDAHGQATWLDQPSGRWIIQVDFTRGDTSFRWEWFLEQVQEDTDILLDLSQLPVLRGLVTQGGTPQAGAELSVYVRGGEPRVNATTRTDAQGHFAFHLAPGDCILSAGQSSRRVGVPTSGEITFDIAP